MLPEVLIGITKVFMAIWVLNVNRVTCIQIDNQLKVITNDCYERLAIGHRLSSKDIYKTVDANTVPKCQKECTNEGDSCKAFSYGIAVKGNSTCNLGRNFIRETSDLQPIGTIRDVDFDLYIKKLGCKLVIDPHVKKNSRPNFNNQFLQSTLNPHDKYQKPPIPSSTPKYKLNQPHHDGHNENTNGKPSEKPSNFNITTSLNRPPEVHQKPTISYQISIPNIETADLQGSYDSSKITTESYPKFTQNVHNRPSNYEVQHVQGSLVSISTGPASYLHPVHEILIGENPYLYGKPKPFRPLSQSPNDFNDPYETPNNSYDKFRPHDQFSHDRPNDDYYGSSYGYYSENLKPEHDKRQNNYRNPDKQGEYQRPHNYEGRPKDPDYSSGPMNYHETSYQKPISDYHDSGEISQLHTYNENRPPFPNPHDDNRLFEQTNHYGYGIHTFRYATEKRYQDFRNQYDDRRNQNSHGNKQSTIKPVNSYDRPQESSDSYNNRRFQTDPYNKERPKPEYYGDFNSLPHDETAYETSYQKPSKPDGYDVNPNSPSFDELPPYRPMYFNRPHYDERPQYPGNGYDENRPTIHDRIDGAYHDRPHYGDHSAQSGSGSLKPFQEIPRPLRPHYDNPRPPRPVDRDEIHLNHPEELQLRPSNSEYLFNDDVKYDTVLNSTQFTHLNASSSLRENATRGTNDTIISSQHSTGKPESHRKNATVKPVVTESIGVDGEKIISIITELDSACFRRVLAGKRVSRRFVRKFLLCERVEDCQLECGEEKHFVCEGFNYRLDPTGHGKGECELLDVPLQRLDVGREVYPDREYDYYERDRNTARSHCQGNAPYPDYGGNRVPARPLYHHPSYDRRSGYDYHLTSLKYDGGSHEYDRRPPYHDRIDYYDKRPASDQGRRWPLDYDKRRPTYGADDRRGDIPYHHSLHTEHGYESHIHIDRNDNTYYGTHYLPPNPSPKPIFSPPYDHKPYYSKPFSYGHIDNRRYDKPNSDHFKVYGIDSYRNYNRNPYIHERKNYYLPPKVGGTKDWGKYGGSYGNFGHDYDNISKNKHVFNWSLDNRNDHKPDDEFKPLLPPSKHGSYLPNTALEINIIHHDQNNIHGIGENLIIPAEPRLTPYSYVKEECSLRSATGFKLGKGIVKKFYVVPNIYECELLCFKERSFSCASYAFRYTISLSSPADNCYLSNKNYKELDYYTDLQPDRDFDIYTMNNMNKCVSPLITSKDSSDCFWRVRSGQRLDHRVVKDSLSVSSIVDCQIECLKSRRFTCRVFSFRYGSPTSDSSLHNCQLTDWPYYELDSRIDFLPESGFEVYERGSFGHGCEPYHFGVRGRPSKIPDIEADQLCYIGFGSPARLLPQATKKALKVESQLDCKAECSKLREESLLQCMSFSYRISSYGGSNCFLSDIYQRDLLPHIDHIHDPNSRLFAWDNYNPQCTILTNRRLHGHDHNHKGREDVIGRFPDEGLNTALDTWRAYSVSGWPCKRGHLCQKNLEVGFWFCKLEGGDANAWDYCCRPDHQCGYSYGFSYPWCYVGPEKTQWRECSDRYYPYVHNLIDKLDQIYPDNNYHLSRPTQWAPSNEGSATNYLPQYGERPSPTVRPGFRPDRPPQPAHERPSQTSLDDYEMQFNEQFLAPPKPGGFGQPRHWPVSYLHKDKPPNITDSQPRLNTPGRNRQTDSKLSAIQSLIDIINSNELKNVQYQITNESNIDDDVLYVKIPLPTNFTKQEKTENNWNKPMAKFETIDLAKSPNNATKRVGKSSDFFETPATMSWKQNGSTRAPTYRRSYITRTNVSSHGRSAF